MFDAPTHLRISAPLRRNVAPAVRPCRAFFSPAVHSHRLSACPHRAAIKRMAKALGEEDGVTLLDENLAQEPEALHQMDKLAARVSYESLARAS